MKKFRIGYFADGPWSHEAFKLLNADNTIEIAFVVPRTNTEDLTLYNFSKENKIDYLKNVNINSDGFIEGVKGYDCDLFVSMSFNQIFKKEIMKIPKLNTINCHAGKLPFYRGRNVLNWVLINDEREFGITVHYIDDGIDTGDILLQRTYPITDKDNYSSLLKVATKQCAIILYDAIKLIVADDLMTVKQNEIDSIGFYCSRRKVGDEIIDWNQSSRKLFNFIRALNQPEGPGARSYLKGHEIIINSAKMNNDAPQYIDIPGSIVGKKGNSFIVKTTDSSIEVSDYVYNKRINIGDRLKQINKNNDSVQNI